LLKDRRGLYMKILRDRIYENKKNIREVERALN